ncbi:MAG TPA: hypothetical protein H9807_02445 [Candidatus Bacteroides merdavium]|uniref:Uncharacterized protein n=1 Tax=Candidatus Bacteroides merdavium TaxID=2838472 RepID=A0A9D2GX32_9BACE|nr:hypothetical protein [Candidatus Bacteroides merdavium]
MANTSKHATPVQVSQDFILLNNHWRIEKRKISAVFVTRLATYRRYPITTGIILLFIAAVSESYICVLMGIAFILSSFLMKTKYILRIKMETGEIRPLMSTNKKELEIIQQEIEKAVMDNNMSENKTVYNKEE